MKHFPVHIDIRNKLVIVIGGGAVAVRKCLSLLDAAAKVRVISPAIDPILEELVTSGRIEHRPMEYRTGDLEGAFLVFAATNCHAVNQSVATEAASRGILVNVADAPETGSFVSPAYISRGDLLITVTTGGASPALARQIRAELEVRFGNEYDKALQLLNAVREKLLTEKRGHQYNKKILNQLVAHDIPALIRNDSLDEIDRLLRGNLGPEYTLCKLRIGIKDPA